MKRIICFVMMAAMLLCVGFGTKSNAAAEPGQEPNFELQPVALDASDPDYNPYAVCREITFTPVDDPSISARELGIMRIQESGGSDFLDCFDDEFLELISTATSVSVAETYYLEQYDELTGEADLVAVSYEEFMNAEPAETEEPIDDELPIIVPGGEEAQGTNAGVIARVDRGHLMVVCKMYQLSGIQSGYCMTTDFRWLAMPAYRGTDLLGITRDSSTAEIPGGFKGYIKYKENKQLYSSIGGRMTVYPVQTVGHSQNLANDDRTSHGYGIRFNVPNNVNPPASMFPNQTFWAREYYNLSGHVQYCGLLKLPSISPQNFNHWVTYLHQKGYQLGLSFSFSVTYPFGASLSVEPRFSPKFNYVPFTVLARYVIK